MHAGDKERQRPADTRRQIPRRQRQNDHAGGQSSTICRGRAILFPTVSFFMEFDKCPGR
ncbi:hypothetical protein [Bianquea renquensis]|uniref:Uncharacterized protein n=1 Tax=Bianquea renquensis TaxID=2763661 RepID=A0A926DUT4_9FIRM|nr:hypothetical protein [Bianquea renquensis]MBC8545101.1 hypothetical protein [Bianquea renquensis]